MSSVKSAAHQFVLRGWSPVRVAPNSKQPVDADWPRRRIGPADVDSAFAETLNVGVLLGAPSGWLIDIDLDAPETVALAPLFLPKTSAIFGRPSKLRSHWLYVTTDATTCRLTDTTGQVLLEVRSTGAQTVFPPSVHPSGELIAWDARPEDEPSQVPYPELLAAVQILAAAALLARHYPAVGSRNDFSLALAGALAHAGWDEDRIESFVRDVATTANDEEAESRATAARDTARKFDKGRKVTGAATLAKIVGEDVVQRTLEWLREADPDGVSPRGRATQATLLVELAANAELFHDEQGVAYATVVVGDHKETHAVESKHLRDFLSHEFWDAHGKVPSRQALHDACGMLRGNACFDGPQLPVFVRVAEAGGAIYIDLGNDTWDVIRVAAEGWTIVRDAPVKFRRPKGARALPMPESGGDIRMLRKFVNLADDDQFVLYVAFLLICFRQSIQFLLLVLNGEQGSTKSTLARVAKELVDPSSSPLQTEPKEPGDLLVGAKHAWLYVIDNLSWLPSWLSDLLCRLSTGGGMTRRQLYSDDEPITIEVQRPVVLTGIGEIVTRGDLLDRSITLTLPAVPDEQRRDETEFWADFHHKKGKILGALLDAVAAGLARLPGMKLSSMPRMAAAARWIAACEAGLPWAEGEFLRAYALNRGDARAAVLESSPIYGPLAGAVKAEFDGTFGQLLDKLREQCADGTERRALPKTAGNLSTALRRIEPHLRAKGWSVERPGRRVRVTPPVDSGDPATATRTDF